ncbi:peptidoglycan-binding protein [Arthrobacter sulfonylureivorans]|uniref:peptidoglycan-binding protein n=1 Tax=Arthrobacter sulfonylureivorans TaxID=2486855 RepID=UPI0039E3C9AD
MSNENGPTPLSPEELEAQSGTALPDKEVASILDLNADLDLAIDAAAPIDLAVAANANVAAPIDAAVSANILSDGSTAQALSDQGVIIDQGIAADATAESAQDSTIDQGNDTVDGTEAPAGSAAAGTDADAGDSGLPEQGITGEEATEPALLPDGTLPDTGSVTEGLGSSLDGNLLNINVDLAADADIAAPINGAVAANANVAAPIDAAVAANIGSIDSQATAVSQQDAIINQQIDGAAEANAGQQSDLEQ